MARLKIVVLALLVASTAHAERRFADEMALETSGSANATGYAWEESLDGAAWQPLGTSTGTRVLVRAPWGVVASYRVYGTRGVERSEASDPSEGVRWVANQIVEPGSTVKLKDVARAAALFGSSLCGREWVNGTCPP